ncbi:MAG: flippase-like domain-containing protein, partial [Actinobacteria bacterium]|nr:flippase-like domain-containing protein [Actinomycetota bacterium]
MTRRFVRIALTLALTGLASVYLVWKIDISRTADELRDAHLGWLALAVAIMVVTVAPMAWRWQRLLAAKGMHDRLRWLLRAYFVAYTA